MKTERESIPALQGESMNRMTHFYRGYRIATRRQLAHHAPA
jgi:hypothetical protein